MAKLDGDPEDGGGVGADASLKGGNTAELVFQNQTHRHQQASTAYMRLACGYTACKILQASRLLII